MIKKASLLHKEEPFLVFLMCYGVIDKFHSFLIQAVCFYFSISWFYHAELNALERYVRSTAQHLLSQTTFIFSIATSMISFLKKFFQN